MKMDNKNTDTNLTGKLLLAMPGMGDPRFEKAVIFMCAYDHDGAMGLMINKTLSEIKFDHMLEELGIVSNIEVPVEHRSVPIMNGGSVETGRGFLLHSNDFAEPETVKVNSDFAVTGTLEALEKIANGNGPENVMFMLGYAGWTMGQLDQELQQNAWLVADPTPEILFSTAPENRWGKSLKNIGIEPGFLSAHGGSA